MNAPIIDLSLLTPQQMMAQKGSFTGSAYVLWFRLLRPSLVGAVWAAICIYAYRYLLPFNQSEMPVEQLTFYLSGIGCIATGFVLWMIASRVAHPFMRQPMAIPLAQASGEIIVESRRTHAPAHAHARRQVGDVHTPRILIASHDAHGAVSAITSNVVEAAARAAAVCGRVAGAGCADVGTQGGGKSGGKRGSEYRGKPGSTGDDGAGLGDSRGPSTGLIVQRRDARCALFLWRPPMMIATEAMLRVRNRMLKPARHAGALALCCVIVLVVQAFIASNVRGATASNASNANSSATAAPRTSGAKARRPGKAARKPVSSDPRSFMHGVGVADAGDGKKWIFFSSSGLPPRGANSDGNWPHDVYVGQWSAGAPRMSNVHIFIQRPEAQEPVSVAQNTLGTIFVTFEDGWNTPNQVNQRYGVYRQDLSPLKPYPNDVASGGHSGHVAAVGERFVVFYSSDWVDGGGVDNLGSGGGVYVSTYDGNGALVGQTDVAPKSREWWPMLAGSPDRALLVWQKFVTGSTSATLAFAMFDPVSGRLDKLGDLQPAIEYYVYAAGWVDAIRRFLVLTTTAQGKGVAVLIDELGNRTALLDDLPATVREANFGVSGKLAYVPARDGRLLTLALAPDSITLQAATPAPVPWGTTGIAGFETAPGALHFVSLTPTGVREADVK